MMSRRIVLLTEGHSEPHAAKTACSLLRYRGEEVVAVLDSTQRGKPVASALGVGTPLQFVGSLEEAPEADTLLIGIAPPGGRIPESWRPVVLDAIGRGMNVVSGLHDFLADDAEFAEAARRHGVQLVDVRRNNFREIARYVPLRRESLRILTVGHDCSVGKMVTAIETTRELERRGEDAYFIATGQTGIMVSGDGLPVDCIVSDFVSGAAEHLVAKHQERDYLVVEGQGSLVHPSYSPVTLGLIHGARPQGMIFCYEIGRETITGIPHLPIPPLDEIMRLNEQVASVLHPCRIIGFAINGRLVGPERTDEECRAIEERYGLPACDVLRHGAAKLADAACQLRQELLSSAR